jgi:hypothetical protein
MSTTYPTESSPPSRVQGPPAEIDLDNLPESLCRSGYRASLRRVGGDLELVAGIYIDDVRIDETRIALMADTPENLALLVRLRMVADAACRFFTICDDSNADLMVHNIAKQVAGMPRWRFAWLRYIKSNRDCTDVLYAAGEDRVIRIVENDFSEPLTSEEVDLWRQLVGPDRDLDEKPDAEAGGEGDA